MRATGPTPPWRQRSAVRQAPARPDAVLQRRGVERMHAILDAAATIMIEDGYEAATLKAISYRTGIPAASVYHYFLDRHQVDSALMLRHLDALDRQVTASLEQVAEHDGVRELVNAVFDPMREYLREHPDCVELRFGQRTAGQDDMVRAFDEATARHAHRLAVDRGLLREDTPLLIMLLAFEVGAHLFDVAFRRLPGVGDDATLDQARAIISRYLELHRRDHDPTGNDDHTGTPAC